MNTRKISPIDLCKASGASLSLIYALVWAGKIKAEKVAGKWLIPAEEAERFVKERRERMGGQK